VRLQVRSPGGVLKTREDWWTGKRSVGHTQFQREEPKNPSASFGKRGCAGGVWEKLHKHEKVPGGLGPTSIVVSDETGSLGSPKEVPVVLGGCSKKIDNHTTTVRMRSQRENNPDKLFCSNTLQLNRREKGTKSK